MAPCRPLWRTFSPVAAWATVALTMLGACSASPAATREPATTVATPPPTELELTEEQRRVLSLVLEKNFEAGGAAISVVLPGGASEMTAEVDWTRHFGHAVAVNDGRTVEFYFGPDHVLDGTVPDLTEALAANGIDGVRFVERALDPAYSTIDLISVFVLGLASEQRENPVGLADQDISYGGRRETQGRSVDVYRFADNVTYLVAVDDGTLVGVDASFKAIGGVVELRVTSLGPREVPGPHPVEVIAGTEISGLYRKLVGKPLPSSATTPTPVSSAG